MSNINQIKLGNTTYDILAKGLLGTSESKTADEIINAIDNTITTSETEGLIKNDGTIDETKYVKSETPSTSIEIPFDSTNGTFEQQYVAYIATTIYGARQNTDGTWTYQYNGCADWDSTNHKLTWSRKIGYTDLTYAEIKSMVDNRVLGTAGQYGACRNLESRIGFHYPGYGNNSTVTNWSYIYNSSVHAFGYVGSRGGASGSNYVAHGLLEISGMTNIEYVVGRINNTQTTDFVSGTHANLKYITISFGANNRTFTFANTPNIEMASIYYTIDTCGTWSGCKIILSADLYDKIFNSSNTDYEQWHYIDVRNQELTYPVTIVLQS